MSDAEWREKVVFPIQFRVVNILNQWLDSCFDDFDAFLITKLNKFIKNSLPMDGHSPLAKKLSKTLIKKVTSHYHSLGHFSHLLDVRHLPILKNLSEYFHKPHQLQKCPVT